MYVSFEARIGKCRILKSFFKQAAGPRAHKRSPDVVKGEGFYRRGFGIIPLAIMGIQEYSLGFWSNGLGSPKEAPAGTKSHPLDIFPG